MLTMRLTTCWPCADLGLGMVVGARHPQTLSEWPAINNPTPRPCNTLYLQGVITHDEFTDTAFANYYRSVDEFTAPFAPVRGDAFPVLAPLLFLPIFSFYFRRFFFRTLVLWAPPVHLHTDGGVGVAKHTNPALSCRRPSSLACCMSTLGRTVRRPRRACACGRSTRGSCRAPTTRPGPHRTTVSVCP